MNVKDLEDAVSARERLGREVRNEIDRLVNASVIYGVPAWDMLGVPTWEELHEDQQEAARCIGEHLYGLGASEARSQAVFGCHCANADDWHKGIVCPICGEGVKVTNAASETKPDRPVASGVVVVDMGPHIGTRRIPIDGTETTVELAEKIRSVLPKEWKVST